MGFIELEIKFLLRVAINPGFVDFAVQTEICRFRITLIPSIDTPWKNPKPSVPSFSEELFWPSIQFAIS